MRHSIFFFCLLFCLGAIAEIKDYSLNVGDFSEFTVASGINVVYRHSTDSAGYAKYSCSPSVASALTFSNDKNKLKIQLANDRTLSEVPTVTIYSMALAKATNWGDSTITILQSIPVTKFQAKVQGNGNIVAPDLHATKVEASVDAGMGRIYFSGKAKEAKYSLISAGSIEAGSLEASTVKCSMVGTGSIDCYVTEKLTIVGMGSGTVYYIGKPETIKNRSIGVKVVEMEQ